MMYSVVPIFKYTINSIISITITTINFSFVMCVSSTDSVIVIVAVVPAHKKYRDIIIIILIPVLQILFVNLGQIEYHGVIMKGKVLLIDQIYLNSCFSLAFPSKAALGFRFFFKAQGPGISKQLNKSMFVGCFSV